MEGMRDIVRGEVGRRWFSGSGEATAVAPRTSFVSSMANSTAFETDDGIVLVDCGLEITGPHIRKAVRERTDAPLDTVVFTHGHVDHACGLGAWIDTEGVSPRIVAHEAVPDRFRRYLRTLGLQEYINRIQFGIDVGWPRRYFWPTLTYRDEITVTVGGEQFVLRHGKGETDDATWLWAPERGILCTGDFWISCVPNCGNPQKVQRYPEEWAGVLAEMASLGAEVLCPGHGPPITGATDVQRALTDASAYLASICEQTLAALNEGGTHEQIVSKVQPPPELADRAYLQPFYDRPEFIVRNLIRLHGGWWDGHPSHLMPADADDRAAEIVRLAGGPDAVVGRARQLASDDLPLACHLAEWAAAAEPSNRAAQECVRDLYSARASQEPSLMGRGIYEHAVREATKALEEL